MPANPGQELASLDFANLIGGPLNAIVDAQARSAIATANFVKQVGFDKDGNVINATFKYSRPNNDGENEEFALTVPFIAMLPIPYVQIETGEVEFNAKITSTQETSQSDSLKVDASLDVSVNYWFVKASLKATTSYQKQSSSTEKVERTYDMHIKVIVKGTDLPTGTERLLSILENSLKEKSTGYLTDSVSTTVKAWDTGTNLLTLVDDAPGTTSIAIAGKSYDATKGTADNTFTLATAPPTPPAAGDGVVAVARKKKA